MSEPWLRLELYVGRERFLAHATEQRLRALLGDRLQDGQYALDVIDVYADPVAAERADCVAVPTLIRRAPQPERRLVGDLSNTDVVALALGLPEPRVDARAAGSA